MEKKVKVIQTLSGERLYETPYGLFPSVTTILQFTRPEEEQKSLLTGENAKEKSRCN